MKILISIFLTSLASAQYADKKDTELIKNGGLPALVELASRQLYGISDTMDHHFILETFQKGADAGIAKAHTGLADCYMWGVGVDPKHPITTKMYQTAAEGGDPRGNLCYGQRLLIGFKVDRDVKRGLQYIQKAADLGHKDANAVMALHSLMGDYAPLDPTKGVKLLDELAKNDANALAAFYLGKYYLGSFNSPKPEPALAKQYLEIAAAKNHAGAITALGDIAMGQKPSAALPKPQETATQYYRKAIQRNSGDAMLKLGKMLQRNTALRKPGENWYQLLISADRVGNNFATQYLGELHYHAPGYTFRDLDWKKSAFYHHRYLERAVDDSMIHISQNRLMEMYAEGGFGLERNYPKCIEVAMPHIEYWGPSTYFIGRILLHTDAPLGNSREHFVRGYACLLKARILKDKRVTDDMLYILRSRHNLTRQEVTRAEKLVKDGFPNQETPLLP